MRSTSAFLIFYVALGAVAAATLSPDLLTIVIFLSFGLALPVAFAPSAFLYVTTLIPAFIARARGLGYVPLLLLTAVPPALLALGPPTLATIIANREFAALRGADFDSPSMQRPRTIAFERRAPSYGGQDSPLRDAICDAICQKLLLNREVDRVIVSALEARGLLWSRVAYTIEKRGACPAAFARAEDALPQTAAALTLGTCIVPVIGGDAVAAVTVSDIVRYQHEPGFDAASSDFALVLRQIRRLDIVNNSGGASARVAHKTEITARVLGTPLLVYPEPTGNTFEIAMRWSRRVEIANPIDLEAELRRVLGYRLVDITAFGDMDSLSMIRALLARPGNEVWGPELIAVLRDVMKPLSRRTPLSDDEIALLGAVIVDHRIKDAFAIVGVLQAHPDLMRRFLPALIERLEAPIDELYDSTDDHLAWAIVDLPPADLAPYARRLFALADGRTEWPKAIVSRAGQLGLDPVALLTELLTSRTLRWAAMVGICRADAKWGAALLLPLEADLAGIESKARVPDEFITGIVALRRFGQGEVADRLIAKFNPEQVADIQQRLARRKTGNTIESCRN